MEKNRRVFFQQWQYFAFDNFPVFTLNYSSDRRAARENPISFIQNSGFIQNSVVKVEHGGLRLFSAN